MQPIQFHNHGVFQAEQEHLNKLAGHQCRLWCRKCGNIDRVDASDDGVPVTKKCSECDGEIQEQDIDFIPGCPCGGTFRMVPACGAKVCDKCRKHQGLERCYCGWSEIRPGQGRQELVEMGETIDPL